MSRFALANLSLCLALGAACSSSSGELVDYQVTGGLTGHGDGSSLTLDTSGVGTRTTRSGGAMPVRLEPAALADLDAKIRDAQFATLQPSYGCNGCTDQYVYDIAVSSSGHHYEVTLDETVDPPAGLQALLTTLKQLAPP